MYSPMERCTDGRFMHGNGRIVHWIGIAYGLTTLCHGRCINAASKRSYLEGGNCTKS